MEYWNLIHTCNEWSKRWNKNGLWELRNILKFNFIFLRFCWWTLNSWTADESEISLEWSCYKQKVGSWSLSLLKKSSGFKEEAYRSITYTCFFLFFLHVSEFNIYMILIVLIVNIFCISCDKNNVEDQMQPIHVT